MICSVVPTPRVRVPTSHIECLFDQNMIGSFQHSYIHCIRCIMYAGNSFSRESQDPRIYLDKSKCPTAAVILAALICRNTEAPLSPLELSQPCRWRFEVAAFHDIYEI